MARSMSRSVLVVVLLSAGCSRAPTAAVSPAVEECTAQTPLVPGVPGSPGHLLPSEFNPNGASALATVMRQMEADLKLARAALATGASRPPMLPRARRMRCTWPTDLADRTPAFDALAVSYLALVKALDEQPQSAQAYANVLKGCRACHSQSCPGPIAAIDALELGHPP